MSRSLAATTRDAELEAVAVGGQIVASAWHQITGHLARRLSPAHAELFAEPSPDPARGATDWYAPGQGRSVPLDSEPSHLQGFEALVDEIRAEADRLLAERDEAQRLMGELLRAALAVPDRNSIRVRGGAVFLVAWGHHATDRGEGAQLVRSLPNTAPPMQMLALGAAPAARRWPWVFLATALLLLMLAMGLALAWRDPFGWLVLRDAQCLVDPADLALLEEHETARAEEIALRRRLAELMVEAGRKRLDCPPPPRPEPPPARPATPARAAALPPAQNADVERANRAGARTGRLQIILAWDDINDLDLYVICPDRQVLGPSNQRACGGTLDVDANHGGGEPSRSATTTPVENAVWDQPPPGRYRVHVRA